jgi:coproporphyrinogen III oxidase-like Fe-S oxidoreductase
VQFHTPNAVHIRSLTPDLCALLYTSGFKTLRLGLETTSKEKQKAWGAKVNTEMFFAAMDNLAGAGFQRQDIGVYLLCGLPGQKPEEVEEAVRTVQAAGARPRLCEYSPVPQTMLWERACATSTFLIAQEPLYQNNTFFACRREDFTYEDLVQLKRIARV